MKRKWIILGNERKFMKDVFELDDKEVDQVKRFMEQDFNSVLELMQLLRKSDLSSNQKILASYIMGNTVGFAAVQDMRNTIEERKTSSDTGMAG